MRAPSALIAVLLLATALAGCAQENDDSPRSAASSESSAETSAENSGQPAKHRAQCTPSDAEGEIILHPGSFTPTGPLTLDDVSLVDPVNLEIIESDVVRFTGRPTISGIVRDYPPLKTAGLADSLADWETRRPLAGLTLDPDDGQQAVLVAVRLTDPGSPGHLDGVVLQDDGGETAYAQPVLVQPPGEICTVEAYESTLDWVP